MGHLLDNKRATLTAWFGGRIGTVAVTKRYKCSADIALRHAPRFKQPLAIFRDESFLGAADDAASEPQRVRLERHVLCDDKGIGNAKQDEEKRAALLRDIRSDAMWLNATVENLLAITRLENGGMHVSTTAELLDDIVEEALRHVNPDAEFHHIEVVPSPDLLLVDVDARLVVQVVVNLVNNAITYTPAGSHICISTRADDGMAVVRVEDDGPGLAEKDRGHIFESFYTAGRTLADSKRSVGLGLALCKSIVEAHGGLIGVAAVNPHGCAFEFSLPLHHLETGDTNHAN